MRNLWKVAGLTLVLCVVAGQIAMAQAPGGRGRGRGGLGQMGTTFLLQNPQVQKELKITEEQQAKLKELNESARAQFGAGAGGGARIQEMTEEQRKAFFEEFQKKTEEAAKKAAAILTETQNTRLKQIQIWTLGTAALTEDDLAKKLNITDDQKGALKTINEESAKKGRELFQGLGRDASQEDRAKAGEQLKALRAETEEECMAVLTDDQKALFEKARGPKFELDMTAMFQRGRGGRPGGGNN